jgi:hypothetical protein
MKLAECCLTVLENFVSIEKAHLHQQRLKTTLNSLNSQADVSYKCVVILAQL